MGGRLRLLVDLFVTLLVINRFSVSVFLDIQLRAANRQGFSTRYSVLSTQCWDGGGERRTGCVGKSQAAGWDLPTTAGLSDAPGISGRLTSLHLVRSVRNKLF